MPQKQWPGELLGTLAHGSLQLGTVALPTPLSSADAVYSSSPHAWSRLSYACVIPHGAVRKAVFFAPRQTDLDLCSFFSTQFRKRHRLGGGIAEKGEGC